VENKENLFCLFIQWNFVTAKKELNEMSNLFSSSQKFSEEITHFASDLDVTWHFIPPYIPHLAGLWEVNVKSVKHNLCRP
jgi:hypothetical protein